MSVNKSNKGAQVALQLAKSLGHFLFRRIFASLLMRSCPQGNINKVLISGYTGLGHFVLKTVLIEKIEELFPGCKVTIICGNEYGIEYVLDGYEKLILKQDSNVFIKLLFFIRLRKIAYDAIFLPFDASPAFIIRGSIIAGIPIRVGHIFEEIPVPAYYYTHSAIVRRKKPRDEIGYNLDLLQTLADKNFRRNGFPKLDPIHNFGVLDGFELEKNRYICVQISAANGVPTSKVWLESNFRKLIERILNRHPEIKIVALGDKGDSIVVNRVCKGFESLRLLNLSGKTTLYETKCLISGAKLLICHDSGLLHIGNAMRKQVIALYGYSEPDIYSINLSTCHIIQRECDCPTPRPGLFPGLFEPTEGQFYAICPVPKCMKRITVDDVYAKCVELLNSPQKK